jgi:hypothetical protein
MGVGDLGVELVRTTGGEWFPEPQARTTRTRHQQSAPTTSPPRTARRSSRRHLRSRSGRRADTRPRHRRNAVVSRSVMRIATGAPLDASFGHHEPCDPERRLSSATIAAKADVRDRYSEPGVRVIRRADARHTRKPSASRAVSPAPMRHAPATELSVTMALDVGAASAGSRDSQGKCNDEAGTAAHYKEAARAHSVSPALVAALIACRPTQHRRVMSRAP